MNISSKMPLKLTIGLALAIILDTTVQIFWKTAADAAPVGDTIAVTAATILQNPLMIAVIILRLCQLVNWLMVLAHADLSYAQPITSLSYVSVCIFSAVYLNEKVDSLEIAGIGCMLAGVWLICSTECVTQTVENEAQ
jgi:drug/metabolite transporter (DMT)-like permease